MRSFYSSSSPSLQCMENDDWWSIMVECGGRHGAWFVRHTVSWSGLCSATVTNCFFILSTIAMCWPCLLPRLNMGWRRPTDMLLFAVSWIERWTLAGLLNHTKILSLDCKNESEPGKHFDHHYAYHISATPRIDANTYHFFSSIIPYRVSGLAYLKSSTYTSEVRIGWLIVSSTSPQLTGWRATRSASFTAQSWK